MRSRRVTVLGAGEPIYPAPLAVEPTSTTVFSGGAVGHVFTARPSPGPTRRPLPGHRLASDRRTEQDAAP